jgi:DNA repair protein RadC
MKKVTNSKLAYEFVKAKICPYQEEVWVLCLNSQKNILFYRCLFKGTVNSCLVHFRDIFRVVIQANSSSFILFHNHPSNNSQPSKTDIQFTRKLALISSLIQVPCDDHIICSDNDFFSFNDNTSYFNNHKINWIEEI